MRRAFHSQKPARARLWVWALGLSLLAHAVMLWPARLSPWVPRPPAAALQTRALVLPAPQPAAEAVPPRPVAAKKVPLPAAMPVEPPTQVAAPATAIAPAAEWLYRLRQDGREGFARLSWQPLDGGYRLLLSREVGARSLPGWRSQGLLDQQGLVPQRYAQQRLGPQGWQDSQATNFRRDEGLISFSASSELVAMPPGVQDRISWWLQLAAIVAGAPPRFRPGSEIRLPVAGLRGEAREWLFEVLAEEPLALPGEVVAAALHLRRAALGPYDGEIELWLDPARGHLPVRLIVGLPEGRGWELQLIDDKAKSAIAGPERE